jgi:zinc/manganese transport system substrate-binding protein
VKRIRQAVIALSTGLALLLSLAGCGLVADAPKQWSRGTGDISIVATSNVWADLAYQIGGKAVTSHAIIFNVNQDPHSYEATVRDRLLVEKADLILLNGGGYDDFMLQLTKEANSQRAPLINAVEVAGTRPDGNEHIWFSIDRVRKVASAVASQLKKVVRPNDNVDIEANLAAVNAKLDAAQARIEQLRPFVAGRKAVLAEPVAAYLAEALYVVDATPMAFTKAVEEDRDVSPETAKELKQLLASGEVALLVFNAATFGSQPQKLLESSGQDVPATEIGELLPQDPDTFQWSGDFFDYLKNSIYAFGLMKGVPSDWSY